ncbi:MAG TPA: OB-fold nucleic acid binding domain-containing protein [Candidatus Angelobacter sp.]|nr:OB-fold nucleic acid binding domain-containing protein [Candidatus Angelobacter sp.]
MRILSGFAILEHPKFLEDHTLHIHRKLVLACILAAITVCMAGCPSHVSIADINKDPGRYAGREVTVGGRVSDSFGALGNGLFQIDDGTGRMWVVSQSYGVPGNGSKVGVTGRIQQGFSFGARSFAVVLKETRERH